MNSFEKSVIETIRQDVEENREHMTMSEFLSKHANGDKTILGFWFDRELEGLTDFEILNKCAWLDLCRSNAIINIFGFEEFEEFVHDYETVAKDCGYFYQYKIDGGGSFKNGKNRSKS